MHLTFIIEGEYFGLVFVDDATQRRIPKDSAYRYRDVTATNGGSLGEESSGEWWASYD